MITTVAAFLANIISPLPPLETFGIALAVGVISAFVNATVVVGALHVVIDSANDKTLLNRLECQGSLRNW